MAARSFLFVYCHWWACDLVLLSSFVLMPFISFVVLCVVSAVLTTSCPCIQHQIPLPFTALIACWLFFFWF